MSQRSSMAWLGCFAFVGFALSACVGSIEVGGGDDGTPLTQLPKADKMDLLLVVDNSRSMADKQEILARNAADLVQSVTNPPCVDMNGNIGETPASPLDPCPSGQTRRHAPVNDIHIGVISTSIGGHGSDSCPNVDVTACQPNDNLTNNDKAHLLSRTDACESSTSIPTYQGRGFLTWDALQTMSPPGSNDSGALAADVAAMVRGVGQIGCGYESQLESWYRFLVDPSPYESISVQNFAAIPMGTDTTLLQQRANFLRPDSMLVILMLTDEDDCSITEFGQYYVAAQLHGLSDPSMPAGAPFRMPRARSECATNPNDPCCKSCGQARGTCPVDPTCADPNGGTGPALLSEAEDNINLRCFDQKRRFGIDFLYPVDRYVDALRQTTIADRNGNMVPNPIFSDLNPSESQSFIRDPGLVFLATISGVPWQEIARDSTDLGAGFKNATEMGQDGTWNAVLGNGSTPPTSPYMISSIAPRTGISAGNAYNGGDRTIATADDLQYSCTFPLETPRDCSDPSIVSCDCTDPSSDNPICNGTLQVGAKAYPSPRTMQVVKDLANQGVLTSICPAQINDDTGADYAYRPVVRALVERIVPRL